jgi:glycosyltransferase involved in cell wall biosynthesis
MDIYIITNGQFPNGMAATNRTKCFAKAIISQGLSCKVLIYTRTERYGKKPKNIDGKGVFEGIPFQYMGKTPLRGKNPFIRKFHDLADKFRLLSYLFQHLKKNDIVISVVGQDADFVQALIKLIHFKQAKFVRELCELPYGTGKETPKAIKKRDYILKKQFPSCDGIIAISDKLMNLAKEYASNKCHIIKIPILVDFEKYYIPDKSSDATTPYIFHSGTLYEQKDGFIGMLEAFGKATELVKKPILFISTGTISKSPHREEIKRIINQYHLKDKVFFTGYISDEELKENLSKASLVIINKYLNQQNTYCFSTKLGEYLAAGKPVIITNVGEAMNWLKDGESAYIVEPNDTDSLAKAIVEAFNNSEKRKMIGINGQKICKKCFDYRNYGAKLQHFFNSITQSNT